LSILIRCLINISTCFTVAGWSTRLASSGRALKTGI